MQSRRRFLALSAAAAAVTASPLHGVGEAAMPKDERDRLTPAQVVDLMKAGNERFRKGVRVNRDFLREQRDRASGQFPAAVILSCIDSRAPAEIVMDLGIGDVFNARVAGNVANADLLGSLEFACQVAGAKVVLVLGHTACGAIKGRDRRRAAREPHRTPGEDRPLRAGHGVRRRAHLRERGVRRCRRRHPRAAHPRRDAARQRHPARARSEGGRRARRCGLRYRHGRCDLAAGHMSPDAGRRVPGRMFRPPAGRVAR